MARPNEYWRLREEANDRAYAKEEAKYQKELNKIYDYAQDQIQKEIDSFYSKYAKAEGITMAEAKKRIDKLDIEEYSRKAEKYSKNKDFSAKANEEMRLYNATMKINRLELLKAKIGLETVAAANDAEKYMKDILQGRTIQEIRRQAGILGKSVGTNVKDVNSLINASFHNATWSERIWSNQSLLQSELSKLLNNAFIQGKGSRELATQLRKTMDVSKYNANRLMRTELKRVTSDSQLSSFIENGFTEYMFMTLSSAPYTKSKVCPICAALDGKTFKIKDAMPGENLPPMHPNCRCSITAHESEEEYQEWLNGIDLDDKKPITTPHFATINSEVNLGSSISLSNVMFATSGAKKNGTIVKILTGEKATIVAPETCIVDGDYFVSNVISKKLGGKEYPCYELKRLEDMTDKDYYKLHEKMHSELSSITDIKKAEELIQRIEKVESYAANKLADGVKAAKNSYDEAVKNGDPKEIKKAKKSFVTNQENVQKWQAKAEARKKYSAALKELEKTDKALKAVEKSLNVDIKKKYKNIWFSEVTLEDFKDKKAAINKKIQYFKDQLDKAFDQKWQDLIDLTKEYEAEGLKYEKYLQDLNDAKKAFQDAEENLAKLVDELAEQSKKDIKLGDKALYTESEKKKAHRFTSGMDAYKSLIDNCAKVWKKITETQKDSIYRYTSTYHPVNEPLRGYEYGTSKYVGISKIDWNNIGVSYKGYKQGFVLQWIRDMSNVIKQSKLNEGYWFVRGCRINGMEKFLNCDMSLLTSGTEAELQKLVGTKVTEHGFMSCGTATGTGFGGDVKLEIYCPRGTEGMYAEPFSAFGNGNGRGWDGDYRQRSVGGEAEIILQCESTFKITAVRREYGTIYVTMELIDQKGFKR